MSTTSKFQQYKSSHMPTMKDVATKPRFNTKTGKLTGSTLQDQYNNGKVPHSLVGMVILKREFDPKTNNVVGWHWTESKTFDKRYITAKRIAGALRKDPYYQYWKQQGLM